MCRGEVYFRYRILACYRVIVISYVVQINTNCYGVMCRKQVLSDLESILSQIIFQLYDVLVERVWTT
jgi:hypothetical protein